MKPTPEQVVAVGKKSKFLTFLDVGIVIDEPDFGALHRLALYFYELGAREERDRVNSAISSLTLPQENIEQVKRVFQEVN